MNGDSMAERPTDAKAEEMLRRYDFIVNTSKDWHNLINREYCYEAVNKAFCIAQEKEREALIGLSLAEMWGEEVFNGIIKENMDRCFAGQEVNYQAWLDLPGKSARNFDITHYPYRDEKGEVSHVVVVTRDITQRTLANEAKRKLEVELQHMRRIEALSTLSGGIAHEFNNALMVVAGNTELLQMTQGENDDVKKFVQATNDTIYRMSNLTQQLLAYAREGDVRLIAVDLSDFVRKSLPMIKHDIGPGTHIEVKLKSNLPAIKADGNQLQMILGAIMRNAAEAMNREGQIRVTTSHAKIGEALTSVHPELTLGDYVCLTIEDEGEGMTTETQSRIFEPFYTTKFQGRGLGMAAVYGVVKNHRGYIYVDSTPGKGTKVRVLMPPMRHRVDPARLSKSAALLEVKTILVIDDEEQVLVTIQSLIEKLGHRVLGVRSAKAAIELIQSHQGKIDLALLDIKLPDMEGDTLYPLIKQARPDMKVLVCSGYSLDRRVQHILKAGAEGFIQKPFTFKTISEKINQVLSGRLDA